MGVVLVGMNHRSAPVSVRERLAFDAEASLRALEALAERTGGAEAVILSTCNRVEIIAFRDDDGPSPAEGLRPAGDLVETVERFLCDFHHIALETVAPHLYRLRGREAVDHLFRVASSLDAMVPGESQILAQVKEAYLLSAEGGWTGKHLNVLFQRAFRVGKRVHNETDIARQRLSVSSVAVALARRALGDLSARTVLVLGAGETGKLTLRSLVASGVGKLIVANRTAARAEEIAGEFRGDVVPWEALADALASADIIISSTASQGVVLGRDDLARAVVGRKDRPLVVIDIAVPRDVQASAGDLEGVHLHDIDDLERIVAEHVDRREADYERSLELVAQEVDAFETWFDRHEAEEVIGELIRRARDASRAELDKLWTTLPDVDDAERREIDAAVTRIVNRILHEPIEVLKRESHSPWPIDVTEIVREVCRLDDDENTPETEADAR